MRAEEKLHDYKRVNSCGHIVEHDPAAFGQSFQLAYGRRLEDVERSKKYKADKKGFPSQGDSDESDQLSCDFVDDDIWGIFAG